MLAARGSLSEFHVTSVNELKSFYAEINQIIEELDLGDRYQIVSKCG
jgi:hypothetical protein